MRERLKIIPYLSSPVDFLDEIAVHPSRAKVIHKRIEHLRLERAGILFGRGRRVVFYLFEVPCWVA